MGETKTDRHWRRWAKQDPYHGVLGRGFDDDAMKSAEVRDLFFAQGEQHIAGVIADIEQLGCTRRGAALDFGCGVGRLVRPLAARFDEVTGVDVSPDMLRLARENVPDERAVSFVRTLDDPALAGKRFDLVHTYIVMQHIRPVQGLPILAALAGLTAPGGALAVHFTVGDLNRTRRRLNAFRYRLPPVHWAYNLRSGLPVSTPISEMNAYPVERVLHLLRPNFEQPMLMRSFDQGEHQGMMIIARRLDD